MGEGSTFHTEHGRRLLEQLKGALLLYAFYTTNAKTMYTKLINIDMYYKSYTILAKAFTESYI